MYSFLLAAALGVADAEPAEDRQSKNVVFVELLGNGGLYSVDYERFVTDSVSVRAGVSVIDVDGGGLVRLRFTAITSPWLANYYVGEGSHKLQLGAGTTLVYDFTDREVSALGTAVIGYRYLPRTAGFTFGIGFTPLVDFSGPSVLPMIGLSVGRNF
jgi:hypothetical protein